MSGQREEGTRMDLEFADLSRPRVEARRSLEEFSGRHYPRRTLAEQRLEEQEREIKQELFNLAMMNAGRRSHEAPRPSPLAVGLGAALCGDVAGGLVGRDFVG